MPEDQKQPSNPHLRAAVEVAFIIFLFYSNLLMGEFTHSSRAGKTLNFALRDIFTLTNFAIGLACAVVGHFIFEMMRRKL
jgi:hypothetical protein